MSRADRHKKAALEVENRLREELRHFDADQIMHLRNSLTACQTTLSRVHKEYVAALANLRAARENMAPELDALLKAAEYVDNFMKTDKAYERSGSGPKLRAALAPYRKVKS